MTKMMPMQADPLERIAGALERLSPPPVSAPDFEAVDAFVWQVSPDRLAPVATVNRVDMSLLLRVDRARDILLQNTVQFARGLPANNALLWGARGMGKSSLVKAIHGAAQEIEAARYDIYTALIRYIEITGRSRAVYQLNNTPIQGLDVVS